MAFTFFGYLFFLYILTLAMHEGAHTVTAFLCTGKFLSFKFTVHKIFGIPCLPSFTWSMPSTTSKSKLLIAEAGFVAEIMTCAIMALASSALGAALSALCALHLMAYPWYSANGGDFYYFSNLED